jgi:cyclopropane fatty-acyl-phospholipid synthase-like methyltransferase
MKKSWFDYFGDMAKQNLPEIIASARHGFHEADMPNIVSDIVSKLQPKPSDRLLEIGCGPGLLMRALAPMVETLVGIDHLNTAERAKASDFPANCSFIGGFWPDVAIDGKFDCLLVYSVLQYTGGVDQALIFVETCLKVMNVGGRLLIGDLPNHDRFNRFSKSFEYAKINTEYASKVSKDREANINSQHVRMSLEKDTVPQNIFINDDFILKLLKYTREKGFDSFIVPQSDNLPMSRSREDLLIIQRSF